MKKYLIYTYIIALILSGIGCKKFLNIIPDNVGTLEYAFRNRNEAENYLFSCYSYMQKLGDVTANPGFLLSSEVIYPINLTSDPINKTGFNIIRGVQNSNAPGLNFWDGEWNGQPLFKGIRLCNTMLENIDQPIDLTPAEKTRWIAEVKFLKAYYHYYLFRMYGPIPLLKVNLAVTSSTEEVRLRRMPVDEVVAYVVSLLDEAVPGLPSTLQNPSTEMGRITNPLRFRLRQTFWLPLPVPCSTVTRTIPDLRISRALHFFLHLIMLKSGNWLQMPVRRLSRNVSSMAVSFIILRCPVTFPN